MNFKEMHEYVNYGRMQYHLGKNGLLLSRMRVHFSCQVTASDTCAQNASGASTDCLYTSSYLRCFNEATSAVPLRECSPLVASRCAPLECPTEWGCVASGGLVRLLRVYVLALMTARRTAGRRTGSSGTHWRNMAGRSVFVGDVGI